MMFVFRCPGPTLSSLRVGAGLVGLAALAFTAPAAAIPAAPGGVCETYPDAALCAESLASCDTCHLGSPPALNVYGEAVHGELTPDIEQTPTAFMSELGGALRAVEALDSDGDGVSNLDEILAGSFPGDALSLPGIGGTCSADDTAVASLPEHGFNTCSTDFAFLLRRVSLDFCGTSPTFEEMQAVRTSDDPRAVVVSRLETCLDSEFWLGKDGFLWNLANDKIRPLKAIKSGDDPGPIPLANYVHDYQLYVWTMLDGHDVRDQLRAQYFVRRVEGPPTTYEQTENTPEQGSLLSLELVEPSRRAGLLTTRWALVNFTMFTALPRTAAARAYRAFLGYDIARLEGLQPVSNEPVDYDDKDVRAEGCAVCHSTLDPLTYPFTRYRGIDDIANSATYDQGRLDDFADEGPNIPSTPEAGVVLGQPVDDLVGWAQVAANSDAFARTVVRDLWVRLVGAEPGLDDDEYERLWIDLRSTHGYSVEAMLRDLIFTEAYSVP